MARAKGNLPPKILNGYLGARGFSAGLAMFFALLYSNALGVERRSIVAFIMTSAVVIGVIFTSGVSLTFRKSMQAPDNKITVNSYIYLTTILSLVASCVTYLSVYVFSRTKIEIPRTLLLITVAYTFFATMDYCLHQALIAFSLFKLASILDVLTICMQVTIYLMLFSANRVSIAVSLFSALILSYITSTITTVLLLIGILDPSIKFKWREIKTLLSASKNLHLLGIGTGFADRIDRIIIAWLLPLGVLGKYAVGTSFISFLRFLPEAMGRWIVSGQLTPTLGKFGKSLLSRVALTLTLVIGGSLLTQIFVKIFFGNAWSLPLLVFIFFACQEIARGYYQVRLSRIVTSGFERTVRNTSIGLIFIAPTFSIIGAVSFGIYGVPLGMAVAYIGLNYYLQRVMAKIPQNDA
jgi:O-antigen/teichoic acid export membrane protein